MIMIIACAVCVISFALNITSSILKYRDYESGHRDSDLNGAMLHFVLALLMVICVILNVKIYSDKVNHTAAQQTEVTQIEI